MKWVKQCKRHSSSLSRSVWLTFLLGLILQTAVHAAVTNPPALADGNANGLPDSWETVGGVKQTLPDIPATPVLATQPITDEGVRFDRIQASATPLTTMAYDKRLCDVSRHWPANRVKVGGRAAGNNEDVCKVQLDTTQTEPALKFLTKWPLNNIYIPLAPEPAWAQFRFSVPQQHQAQDLEYEISWYKLFGSTPTNCHSSELDAATGKCKLDVTANWQSGVDAGIYLVWAKPGDTKPLVTGPHAPIQTIGYSARATFRAPVPDAYKNAVEVDVSLVAFNQYTKGCNLAAPTTCTTSENENFHIHSVALKTAKAFAPPRQPATAHPRILGDNARWLAYIKPLDSLPCRTTQYDSDWGLVPNVRNIWDTYTRGGAPCKSALPAKLSAVADAAFYLTPPANPVWTRDRALRVMFLLRRQKACLASGGQCDYSAAETQALQSAFLQYEMKRLPSEVWTNNERCFDLGTEPSMKFWSLLVDIFWSDLSDEQKAKIAAPMSPRIDCYLQQADSKDWSLYNGNNWTPVLNAGALYWAIAYYHEDPRAKNVLREALQTLWLHRDFYLTDGAYKEGLVEYTNVSYSSLRDINNLMLQSFGMPIDSVRWERIAKTSNWFLSFMAPDGKMVDFGDSWDKRGWSTNDPLYMLLWQEMTGAKPIGSVTVDACVAKDYFSNGWFAKGLENPWLVQPSMARDWQALVDQCKTTATASTKSILFDQGQTGALRTFRPGATTLAKQSGLRYAQADQTYLAVSAVPGDFPHRELDFGGLIWSAYGNRLLYDLSYGQIGKSAQNKPYLIEENGQQLFDNLPLGANTLVVEDATRTGYTSGSYSNATINTSQIFGERGRIENVSLNGQSGFHLDAQALYGANNTEFGWLRYFDRWMLALGDGNFVVVDAFAVKEARGKADVQEYWHTAADAVTDPSTCSYATETVAMGLANNNQTLTLQPRCASLDRTAMSTVAGRIHAASWQAGTFSIDPTIIQYRNRLNGTTPRQRARFKALAPVSEDVRVFLLQAAPTTGALTPASVTKVACSEGVCFDVVSNGVQKRLIMQKTTANRYQPLSLLAAAVDTDKDGILDSQDTDDDNDGIPDVWELQYGLNPLDAADAKADKDNDGVSNQQEYMAKTDPTLATSVPTNWRLGINLSGVADWSTQRPFIDLFKQSRPWLTQCHSSRDPDCAGRWETNESAKLNLDANGWVKSLPAPAEPGYSIASTLLDVPKSFPSGRYLVLYDGEGSMNYGLGASKIVAESKPGRDVLYIDVNRGLILIQIAETDPKKTGNYIRNIRLIREADEKTVQTQLFNPDFIARIQPLQALRFMDWQATNGSDLQSWANRSKPTDSRYFAAGGVPVEIMIQLANQTNKPAWFNMPHKADDDYMRQFATLVRDTLNPQVPIYVEYSNEVWNTMFSQHAWISEQARKLWPGGNDSDYTKVINWYGKRTAEMCDIWKTAFGSQAGRVTCVLGAQAANSWTAAAALDCALWDKKPCSAHGIDAVAIAPYFGNYLGTPDNQSAVKQWTTEADGGLSKLFAELKTGGVLKGGPAGGAVAESWRWIDDYTTLTSARRLQLVGYEGGQHLVGVLGVENDDAITQLFITANRDPRMGAIYLDYLRGWEKRNGKLMLMYSDIGISSKWGSWGVLEHVLQTNSPKYDALLDYIAGTEYEAVVTLSASATTLSEKGGSITLTAQLDKKLTKPVTLTLSLGGNAVQDSDYKLSAATLVIPANSLSGTLRIDAINDTLIEKAEKISISIGSIAGDARSIASPLQLTLTQEDTDQDGMPDDWEQYYGLNPASAADATLDKDGDGVSNKNEFLAGTNPSVKETVSTLGTNLSGLADWSSEMPMLDLFKMSRQWITQCSTPRDPGCTGQWDTGEEALLDLDANGWVKSLPKPEDSPIYTGVSAYWAMFPEFKGGRYVVLYEGEGKLSYGFSAKLVESKPGRDVVDIYPDSNNGAAIIVGLGSTDPNKTGNYLRNIRMIPLAYENTYTQQPFNPDFLDRTRPFQVLRFMDWMNTNNATLANWSQRPLPENARYTQGKGFPLETMLALSNTLDRDPWFNMPHMATDDFMRQFATLTKAKLKAGRKVYVEYSNEVWNGIFAQSSYALAQGRAQWPDSMADDHTIRMNWYGKRTAEMCQIWKDVFGNDASRVVCVMGGQSVWTFPAEQALNCPLWKAGPCSQYGIDAVAIAPYFGGYLGDPAVKTQIETWLKDADGGLGKMFNELQNGNTLSNSPGMGAVKQAALGMASHKQLAQQRGLKLVGYEGGQHIADIWGTLGDGIVNLFTKANRDPRMGQIYTDYLNTWKQQGGDVMVHFTDIGVASRFGAWGALEHIGQTTSAKYAALLQYLNATNPDRDGDGVNNDQDAFPDDPKESVDTDKDKIGNNADTDDDNDGMPDVWEVKYGLNPLSASDANSDADSDGISNLLEYKDGSDPKVKTVVPDLALTASSVANLTADTFTRHTFTVKNNGTVEAKNVILTVKWPDNVERVAVTLSQGQASCPLSTLDALQANCTFPATGDTFLVGTVAAGKTATVDVVNRYSKAVAGASLAVTSSVTTGSREVALANNQVQQTFLVKANSLFQGCDYTNLVSVSPYAATIKVINHYHALASVPTDARMLKLFGFSDSNQQAQLEGDGFRWSAVQAGNYPSHIWSVAKSDKSSRYVGVSLQGGVYWSDNRVTWTAVTGITSTAFADVAYANGRFIAVGDQGLIITSTDGATWQKVTSGTTAKLAYIERGNNEWVAGGQGVILSSADGLSWTRRFSSTVMDVSGLEQGAVWNGSQYLLFDAAGNSFILSNSLAALPAVFQPKVDNVAEIPTARTWSAVFWQDGEYIALTTKGLLGSADGRNWTTRKVLDYPYVYQRFADKVVIAGAYGSVWAGACTPLGTAVNYFLSQQDVLPASVRESNVITLSGLSGSVAVSITGGEYRINGGAYTAVAGTVKNGDTLQVRHTAASQSAALVTSTLKVGSKILTFSSTTLVVDNVPDGMSFTSVSGVALNSVVQSNVVTVKGINVPLTVTVSGGEYRINAGTYTAVAGTVKVGDTLQIRHTSATTAKKTVTTTLSVGTTKLTFASTTP